MRVDGGRCQYLPHSQRGYLLAESSDQAAKQAEAVFGKNALQDLSVAAVWLGLR